MKRIIKLLFPNAIPLYHPSKVNGNSNNSTVLLLGWLGSNRKNLNKTIDIYTNIGVNVISTTMPFFIPGFLRYYVEDLIVNEYNNHINKSDLLIHLYSNNGAWVYSSLYQRKLLPLPKLVVWDSSPNFWYQKLTIFQESFIFTRILTASILKKPIYEHPIISPLLRALLLPPLLICKIVDYIQGKLNIITRFEILNVYLRDESPKVKTLFIYSLGDTIIPPESIKEFIDELKRRGFEINEEIFDEKVPHVCSVFMHTNRYREIIIKYINKN